MYDRSQLNKGILEGCILKIISKTETYGYDIISYLTKAGFQNIKESTIYPLLVRLERKELIIAEYRPSPLGPDRKYYHITPEGILYLTEFINIWKETEIYVNYILDWRNCYNV